MRRRLRSLVFGLLLAAGCVDATFELMPPPEAEAGTAGNPATGGLGAASGMPGAGGLPAGGPNMPDRPNACDFHPTPEDCTPCFGNEYCEDDPRAPYCSFAYGYCVPCRFGSDCPTKGGCEDDCNGERCTRDPTPHCAPDCANDACPDALPRCDDDLDICTQCAPDPSPYFNCPEPLVCSHWGDCVECVSPQFCPDALKPVCDFFTARCRACRANEECGAGRYCERDSGRCMQAPQQNP